MQTALLLYFVIHVVGRHQKSEGFLLEVSPPGDTFLWDRKFRKSCSGTPSKIRRIFVRSVAAGRHFFTLIGRILSH